MKENIQKIPPLIEYGGFDMQEYFAYLLYGYCVSMYMINTGVDYFESTQMGTNQLSNDRFSKISDLLKENGQYSYLDSKLQPKGSPYRDYKIATNRRFGKGELGKWCRSQTKMHMHPDEVFEICLAEVKTWWD